MFQARQQRALPPARIIADHVGDLLARDLRTAKRDLHRAVESWASETWASNDSVVRALHAVADAADPRLRNAFIAAVTKTRSEADRAALEAALSVGDIDRAIGAIRWSEVGEAELLDSLPPILQQTVIAAGQATASALNIGIGFNVTNPRVAAWAQNHGVALVVEVSSSQREALRAAIVQSIEAGLQVNQTAKMVLDAGLGLTQRQVNAVHAYRRELLDEGRPEDQVQRMTDKYARRTLRKRAELIGRTESIAAAKQGHREQLVEAREEGSIDETARRKWLVTDDDRLDEEICLPMAEHALVGLDEPFTLPDGTAVMTPPAHPACRCTTTLVLKG
jgi:hypothetical protein